VSESAGQDADIAERPYLQYRTEIDTYDRWCKDWVRRARKIVKLYRDDRRVEAYSREDNGKRFNILWSNVQTLQPALYARMPVPVVERRWRDADPVARTASEILERAITFTIGNWRFNHVMKAVRDDRLLAGRGTAWVRYDAYTEAQSAEATITDDASEAGGEKAEQTERLQGECVEFDYIGWEDFGHNQARTWSEVYLVWRRVMMTRKQLVERFGQDIGSRVPLDAKPPTDKNDSSARSRNEIYARAWVYEIWDKRTNSVVWLSRGFPELLDDRDDPYGLEDFFPCPRPLYATTTTDTLIPVPDYALYQDQATELDELNHRRALLTEACKVAGVYDGAQDASLGRLLTGGENKLIPVQNWSGLAERGGLKGVIDYLPLDTIVAALAQITAQMQVVKQEIYEITGIADIVRGASNAAETATAQEIKGRYANLRLTDMQGEVARFARDLIAIAGEIISEHFQPQTVMQMASMELPSEQQAMMTGQPIPPGTPTVESVFGLLHDDRLRSFRIDVETDSTIASDDAANKQAAQEFLASVGGFLKEAMPMVQSAPEMLPMVSETVSWLVRQYRAGRQLEGAIEQSMAALQQKSAQGPAPDPKVQETKAKMQLEQKKMEADIELQRARAEADLQIMREKAATDLQLAREEMGMKAEAAREDFALRRAVSQVDLTMRQQDGENAREMERMKIAGPREVQFEDLLSRRQAEIAGSMTQPIDARLQQVTAALGQAVHMLQAVAQQAQVIEARLESVASDIAAPAEIVRGPDGRAMGVRKGGRVRMIERGPDGRAAGLN
jgi:hypothetical protein